MPPDQVSFIPCRAEDVTIKYEALRELHWLDLFPSYSSGFQKLKLSIGISKPEKEGSTDYLQLIKEVNQNLLKYKLSQAKHVLNDPFLFQNPTWLSEVHVQARKTLRRLYETITRVQMTIPMYNYTAHEVGNHQFMISFKHVKDFQSFSQQLEDLLKNDGVQILNINTQKDKIPEGCSVLVIPPDDCSAAMIKGADGRSVFVSSDGAYDADTGEKVSDEELSNLSPGEGININKG